MQKLLSLEWTWKLSCAEKKQRNNQPYDHYLIRLANKNSISYASKISNQQILLPIITGWRSKQRHFWRNTNKQVLETPLDNKEIFEHAMEQFDLELNSKSELKLITPPMSKKWKTMRQLELPSNEPRESYLSGLISTNPETTETNFSNKFPFATLH